MATSRRGRRAAEGAAGRWRRPPPPSARSRPCGMAIACSPQDRERCAATGTTRVGGRVPSTLPIDAVATRARPSARSGDHAPPSAPCERSASTRRAATCPTACSRREHGVDARLFGEQELAERRAVQKLIVPAGALQRLAPRGARDERATRSVSAACSAALMPGGATTARQFARSSGTPDSRSVGASMPGVAYGRRHRQHAQLAGGDRLRELAVAAHARGHLAAEHRGERFAAARERHVVDRGRRHARLLRRAGAPAGRRCRRPSRRPTRRCCGARLNAATRSCSVRNGDGAGTTITSYSPVSRAIGVVSASDTGEPW